jgi:hypothetical protein
MLRKKGILLFHLFLEVDGLTSERPLRGMRVGCTWSRLPGFDSIPCAFVGVQGQQGFRRGRDPGSFWRGRCWRSGRSLSAYRTHPDLSNGSDGSVRGTPSKGAPKAMRSSSPKVEISSFFVQPWIASGTDRKFFSVSSGGPGAGCATRSSAGVERGGVAHGAVGGGG